MTFLTLKWQSTWYNNLLWVDIGLLCSSTQQVGDGSIGTNKLCIIAGYFKNTQWQSHRNIWNFGTQYSYMNRQAIWIHKWNERVKQWYMIHIHMDSSMNLYMWIHMNSLLMWIHICNLNWNMNELKYEFIWLCEFMGIRKSTCATQEFIHVNYNAKNSYLIFLNSYCEFMAES